MSYYETSTTVGGQGEIHLAGVPFQPGTEVDVTIHPKAPYSAKGTNANHRVSSLLAALDLARNDQPVGPLRRDELYDRNNVY